MTKSKNADGTSPAVEPAEEGINSDPVEKVIVEPTTSPAEGKNAETEPTFTQDEVNLLLGGVRKEGRVTGEKNAIDGVLETTGVESLDDLAQIVAEHKDLKLSAMSDKERLETELAEANLATERAESRESELSSTVEVARLKSAIIGAAAGLFESAEAAYMLLDKSDLALDDAGNIEGVDEALEALLETYPFLKKGGHTSIVSSTNPINPKAPSGRTDEQRRDEYFGMAKTDRFWKSGSVRKVIEQ